MNKQNDLSILIIGYDGYIDVWENFVYFINKYWSHRPMTYLATSELQPDFPNIKVIPSGKNSEWSKKAQTALKEIKTKYVLLLLEDFFITDEVDNEKISEILEFIKENDVKFYQLTTQYISKIFVEGKPLKDNKHIHIIPKDKKYGINLQAAIWETDFLRNTIGDGNYNAWTFECNNLSLNHYDESKTQYLIDDRNILNILHAVLQSKYLPYAVKRCKELGHPLNVEQRPILSKLENAKYSLKLLAYSLTPKKLVKPIKKLARHLNFNFVTDKYLKGDNK